VRFVLYARASTQDNQTPEHQIAELRTWCAVNGHEIAREIVERASGTRDSRPLWNGALHDVLAGKAEGIAAVEMSRFARSAPHLLNVAKALRVAGRHLVVTRRRVDTTTPEGRLLFTIQAALDEYVADIGKDAIRSGIRYARARSGGAWGRRREVLPPRTLAAARELQAAGLSWRRISARLFAAGHAQPARDRGKSAHPARAWPVGTLRDALAGVELPPANGAPNPANGAG
jgi:DNA invertase Pin-like site-specific DNA recombinase